MAKNKDKDKNPEGEPAGEMTTTAAGGLQAAVNPAAAFLTEIEGTARAEPSAVPIIKIKHTEERFLLPDGSLVSKISGYPLYFFLTRSWYKNPFVKGQKNPPDCFSSDLVRPSPHSLDKQSETCYDCRQNEFGTGRDGRSKACREFTWLVLFNPAFGSPPIALLVTGPSSHVVWHGSKFSGGFLAQARAKYGAYQVAFSDIELVKAGEIHCVVKPTALRSCSDPAEQKSLAEFYRTWIPIIEKFRGTGEAVREAEQE